MFFRTGVSRACITFMGMKAAAPGTWTLQVILLSMLTTGCKPESKPKPERINEMTEVYTPVTVDYDTTQWKEILEGNGYDIDIRYATTDNFVKEVIYPCPRFFLRPKVAAALDRAKQELKVMGYAFKLFDGYRPKSAQQKLWDKVPNPDYVAPPSEGSMHNRGVAVDLTLTDMEGKELEMGTPYDFFGVEAHHDFTQLPEDMLRRRALLKSVMEKYGFQSIRTEWWHYSYTVGSYPLDDWQWKCLN